MLTQITFFASRFVLRFLCCIALCGVAVPLSLVAAPRYESPFAPTSAYSMHTIAGFTVYVAPDGASHQRQADEALRTLNVQLTNVVRAVSPGQLNFFQTVPIWVEWDMGSTNGGQYNPSSAEELADKGQNPDKSHGIEFNVRTLVNMSHPWMMMHEMAHAYHFSVLKKDNADIADAYQQAMDRKLYDSVRVMDGTKRRAYAAANRFEYFAELSTSYFGKNLFYPYTRADLKKHDPVGYRLMEESWSVPGATHGLLEEESQSGESRPGGSQ
jgi:hypothetical protein